LVENRKNLIELGKLENWRFENLIIGWFKFSSLKIIDNNMGLEYLKFDNCIVRVFIKKIANIHHK
jgi:hypothetical protein